MFPWILASLLLVSHVAFAKQPKSPRHYDGYEPIVQDPEPNWESAAYVCPLSIKLKTGEYKFRNYYVYDYDTKDGRWYFLPPEPAVNIHYSRFENGEQLYILSLRKNRYGNHHSRKRCDCLRRKGSMLDNRSLYRKEKAIGRAQ